MDKIRAYLPETELLAQLAEECMELGQAALKLRRVLDGRNPTPKTLEEAVEDLNEEWADVTFCMAELAQYVDKERVAATIARKQNRWLRRLEERDGG